MKSSRVLLALLFLAGCDSSMTCDDCVDGGDPVDGSVDAGSVDAGVDAGSDAGPPPLPMPDPWDCTTADPGITFGDPIVADPLTWTWVPFDGTACMNGTPTGIGVNINPDSPNLMILFEGGGACFDSISCIGAANPGGYGEAEFTSNVPTLLSNGILDRNDLASPVSDWSFVYVPYCSGDVHGGTNPDGIGGRQFLGYRNFTAFLSRIVPTFDSVDQVLLAGRSAGGLGAIINYPQTANAFGCTPVHSFNDSGGILTDDYMRPCLQTLVRDVWGLSDVMPADCDLCTGADGGGLVNTLPYAAARYPDRHFGFATFTADRTFRTFYGYGYSPACNFPQNMPAEDYAAGLDGVRGLLSTFDNFRTYYVDGDTHTFSYERLSRTSSRGTVLSDWLEGLIDGAPTWVDVGP